MNNDLLEYARTAKSAPRTQPPRADRRPVPPVRPNRTVRTRSASTFNLILGMLVAGGVVVFTVNNIIAVNSLAYQVNRLQVRYDSVQNVNAMLQAEVNRKTALERIGAVAVGELHLQYAHEQPVWVEVDPELLRRLAGE